MKFKNYVVVCMTTVFVSMVALISTAVVFGAPKDKVPEDSITGVITAEVIEPTKTEPEKTRFFIQRCNGLPCDFLQEAILSDIRNGSRTQFPAGLQIQRIYLETDLDMHPYLNRKLTLVGQARNPLSVWNISKQSMVTFNQTFVVSKIAKVFPEPIVNQLVADPIILPPRTVGYKNVIVMPINFASNPIISYSQQQLKDWVFTGERSAKRYYNDVSFYDAYTGDGLTFKGMNDPTGDVTPYLTLTADPTEPCAQPIGNAWRIEADNLATQAGYPVAPNQIRVLLYMPIPGCSLTAQAQVGILGNNSTVTYVFMQISGTASPQYMVDHLRTLLHELGHACGLARHFGGQQTETSPVIEYGDAGDPMGGSATIVPLYFSNINRIRFGWYETAQLFPVIQTQGEHSFFLQTPAVQTKGIGPNSPPIGAFIPLRDSSGALTGEVFMLERRINIGPWDIFQSDAQAYAKGVSIRRALLNFGDFSSPTVLQDTTPGTTCCKDAPLVPGPLGTATWTSQLYGITVTAYTGTRRSQRVVVTLDSRYPAVAPFDSGGRNSF